MEILARLINIKYNYKEIEYENKDGIALKIKSVNFVPLESQDNIKLDIETGIVMNTHQTYKEKGIYQLALEFKDIEENDNIKCRVRVGSKYIYDFRWYKPKNIFFESSMYVKDYRGKLQLKKDESTAFTTSGVYFIDIFNNDKIVKSIEVKVMPSSISYSDYLEMIKELREIREGLIIDSRSKVGVFTKWNSKIKNIEDRLKKVEKELKKIEKDPRTTLVSSIEETFYNKVNKIDSKFLIEKSKNPYKKKYNQRVDNISTDLYEHKAIKYALEEIDKKVKEYKDRLNEDIDKEKIEILKVIKNFNEISNVKIRDRYRELKKGRVEVEKALNSIKNYKYNILNKHPNIIYVDFNVNKLDLCDEEFKGTMFLDLKINEQDGRFELKIDSQYSKGEFYLSLSPDLTNKESFTYRELKMGKDNKAKWDKEISGILESKKFSCTLVSNDINEIIYLYEKLSDNNLEDINIKAIAEKDVNSDYIFGGENKGYYRVFTMNLVKIYSINDEEVPIYSENEIMSFVEEYLTKLNKEDINLRKDSDEFKFIDAIRMKIEDIKGIKTKVNDNYYCENIDNIFNNISNLNIIKSIDNNKKIYLKPTQIFINDSRYRKVYRNLKKLDDEIMYSFDKSNNYILMNSTQNIYEIWCLFAIVDLLINEMGWTILNKNNVKYVLDNLLSDKSDKNISGLEIDLLYEYSSKLDIKMKLIYEGKVLYDDNKYKCLDYQLILSIYDKVNSIEFKPVRAYLDAKYRNYEVQGFNETFIKKDIIGVAIEKYLETFLGSDNEPIVSMIAHSHNDSKYIEYGTYENDVYKMFEGDKSILKAHSYGGFPLVPSNKRGLKNFLKIILEYHLSLYEVCWNCGEAVNIEKIEKVTISGFAKYHYICKECNEFWVKNHCSVPKLNHHIIKHIENYHEIKEGTNPWHVVCPECGDIIKSKQNNNNEFINREMINIKGINKKYNNTYRNNYVSSMYEIPDEIDGKVYCSEDGKYHDIEWASLYDGSRD